MTKIIQTKHYIERAEERFDRELAYYNETFKYLVKKMKKKGHRLNIRPGMSPNVWSLLDGGIIYVYKKELGEYKLLTIYKNNSDKIVRND